MNFTTLVQSIQQTHNALQQQAVSAVNRSLTVRNWLIGFYIVKFEQKGEDRAGYGHRLLELIAADIKKAGIKGLTAPELSRCRQFYFVYPEIFGVLSQKSFPQLSHILGTVSQELESLKIPAETGVAPEKLVSSLSFSHFVELIKIDDPLKRSYYELITIRHTLSVRQLKREIATLSYERIGLSKDKDLSLKKIAAHVQPEEPVQAIKDVYVFDFLNLPNYSAIEEADLEKALLDHLQKFIIELGHGFCFEARQQKILIGNRYYFIDLVFYHRILKCHVLIDLKVEEFDHVNAGQLNTYLNYYKKEISQPNDNPPVGILMVTNKNEALVEYATAGMDNKLFVSKYLVQLPSKEQLQQFVKNELQQL
jgi:predicted nuclease of restriction endonuclease-like (RecB) superfamily